MPYEPKNAINCVPSRLRILISPVLTIPFSRGSERTHSSCLFALFGVHKYFSSFQRRQVVLVHLHLPLIRFCHELLVVLSQEVKSFRFPLSCTKAGQLRCCTNQLSSTVFLEAPFYTFGDVKIYLYLQMAKMHKS